MVTQSGVAPETNCIHDQSNDVEEMTGALAKMRAKKTLPWQMIILGWLFAAAIFVMFCLLCMFLTSDFSDSKATQWIVRAIVSLILTGLLVQPMILSLRSNYGVVNAIALSLEVEGAL